MGTWGPAIFSDDVACEVRDEYRDLVGEGLDGAAATDRILGEWRDAVADPEVGGVFWLALAATQWRVGRLEERVRAEALRVIESGRDLERWQDPRQRRKRAGNLDRLAATLRSPQPAARRVRRPFKDTCDWNLGEIVAYTLASGDRVLFHVVGFNDDKGGRSPIVELLDWRGTELPGADDLERLEPLRGPPPGDAECFMIGRVSARELPAHRVQRTGVVAAFIVDQMHPYVVLWRNLDRQLDELYGIR